MAMTNEEKSYLKNKIVEMSKKSNKKVYIRTEKSSVGRDVATILENYKSDLTGGNPWVDVNKGASYKDFTLVFDKKDHANTFKSNMDKIKSAQYSDSSETIAPESATTTETTSGNSSSTILFAVAGVIILIAIGVIVWKKSK